MSRSYAAVTFPDHGPTEHGHVSLGAAGLRFDGAARSVEMPWSGLRLETGGFNGEQIFASHPSHPGLRVQITDSAFPHDPQLAAHATLAAQTAALLRRRRAMPLAAKLALVLLVLLGALIALVFMNADRIVDAAVSRIPRDMETKFGDMVHATMAADLKPATDPAHVKRLDVILKRLRPAQKSGYDFRLHAVEDETINAFALPGGHIVVFTGLLNAARTNEELAGVIAHEMAHVIHRHSLRRLVKSAGWSALISLFIGDASTLGGLASEAAGTLGRQAFSRDYEREADDAGWGILLDARVRPQGMIGIFHRFKAEEGKIGSAVPALFLSHPATDERIARLRELERRLPAGAAFEPIR